MVDTQSVTRGWLQAATPVMDFAFAGSCVKRDAKDFHILHADDLNDAGEWEDPGRSPTVPRRRTCELTHLAGAQTAGTKWVGHSAPW